MVRLLLTLLLLAGCAASPSLDIKFSGQHNRGSDWALQPERDWTPGEPQARVNLMLGGELRNGLTCGVDVMIVGPWNRAFIRCDYRQRIGRFVVMPSLVHQVDSMTEPFLRTDQRQWQGYNPFIHLRVGYELNPAFSVGVSSGMSTKAIAGGKIWNRSTHIPDLYWINYDFTVRLWGKRGLFSAQHRSR